MKRFCTSTLAAWIAAISLPAQTVTLENTVAKMDLSLSGGVIRSLRLKAIDINPVHEYGHFLCFDRWGPSSPEDQALGIPFHGNASKVSWTLHQGPVLKEGHYFTEMSCSLPVVKLGMNRKIFLDRNSAVFKVVEEITNHGDSARVFNLVQHPTIGSPFLDESTIVDTRVDSGYSQEGNLPPTPEYVLQWPETLLDGDSADLRYLAGDQDWWQAVVTFSLDEKETHGWVTAVNPSLQLMLGYIWPVADYPWLNLWMNIKNQEPFARGLEFGSTGLHQTWPEVLAMDTIFGKKLYELIDLDDTLVKSYYAILSAIPADYKGVESVTLEGRKIKVEEYGRDPGRRIVVDIGGILASEVDVRIIDGGAENGGSLEQTINGDTMDTGERANPFRIYELKAGKTYYQQGPIEVDNPDGIITIRGQPGGRKPVILKKVVDDDEIGTNRINSSLVLQNLQYHTMESDSGMAFTAWNILGNDHTLRVEGCLFEHCNGRLFNLNDVRSGAEIVIRDSYFRDLHAFEQWWGGSIVECKIPVDSFYFENNTVSGAGLTVLGQECLFDHAVINHNTFVNNHKHPFLNHYWKEVYFTNNLFVNANMVGEDMENIITGGGAILDAQLHGIIGVDSIHPELRIQGRYLNADSTALTEEVNGLDDIIYYAADNVVTYSTALDPYYFGTVDGVWEDAPASYLTWGGTEGPFKVLNVPGIWNNERTQAWIAAYGNLRDENNHIYTITLDSLGLATDPLPQDAADVFVQWNRKKWEVPGVEEPTDHSAYYFGDYDPATIPGVETEDSDAGGITKISDMTEDFSYTLDLTSKSDGLRIGALHWEDETFDREASLAAVKNAYARTTFVPEMPTSSSRFNLTNYPNPFQQETVISYSLPREGQVRLEVYNTVGRRIRVLVDEFQPTGHYQVVFHASGIPAGLYFCRITSGSSQRQEKMICLGR